MRLDHLLSKEKREQPGRGCLAEPRSAFEVRIPLFNLRGTEGEWKREEDEVASGMGV